MFATKNSVCQIYLPQGTNKIISVETVTDFHPKTACNEIIISPVVHIVSDHKHLPGEKPAIIELTKTIELSEKEEKNSAIPMYSSSKLTEWKELGSESNCQVLKHHITFEVTDFSYFAVISRKPRPSSSVKVKPVIDTCVADQLPPLTIPELPGFKVQISPSSVITDEEVEVTATAFYDSPALCKSKDRDRLASSCIELEPHGLTFSKEVCISIPIPNYSEIKRDHPDAELQIWHANKQTDSKKELDWTLVEHRICQDEEGQHVAIVLTKHFSYFTPLWNMCVWAKDLFCGTNSFCIKARCQAFMSKEISVQSNLIFNVTLLFYPYKEEPEPVPCNYKHMLLDSDLLDLQISNDDSISYQLKFHEWLSPREYTSQGKFDFSGRQQKTFNVTIDGGVKIQGGSPMGTLSIGTQQTSTENHHTLGLIKVGN